MGRDFLLHGDYIDVTVSSGHGGSFFVIFVSLFLFFFLYFKVVTVAYSPISRVDLRMFKQLRGLF